jgi:hypothetical protein
MSERVRCPLANLRLQPPLTTKEKSDSSSDELLPRDRDSRDVILISYIMARVFHARECWRGAKSGGDH